MRIFLFLLVMFLPAVSFANNNLHQHISVSTGIVNVNVTENASTLSSTDESIVQEETAAASTAISVVSLNLTYEFQNYVQKSYFMKATAPLLSADGSGFFFGGLRSKLLL